MTAGSRYNSLDSTYASHVKLFLLYGERVYTYKWVMGDYNVE